MTSPSPTVSVIIPVYNTEPYLEKCLNSVVDQAFQDLEILIVNDGSTDGSPDIIRRYSERDKRIVVFNKENEGVAVARNAALAAARGTYLMFLDSDDAFAPGAIATLYERICREDCDILIFNGRAVQDDEAIRGGAGEFYFDLGRQDEDTIASGMYWLKRTGGRIHHVGMKMYHREFVIQNKLDFGRHRVGEDTHFFYRSMVLAHRVAYAHFPAYIRRYRPGSLVTDETVFTVSERIRAFHQLTLKLGSVQDQASRRVIGSQQAYYTAALWILAMTRHDPAERLALVSEFQKVGFYALIHENRHDWKLWVIYGILCLPAGFLPLQVLFARALRRIFKTRTRLF